MGRINVRDVASVSQFTREFDTSLRKLMSMPSQVSLEVIEACAWIENTIKAAEHELTEARQHLEECEDLLRNCEAEENDDYLPDCSSEADEVRDAEDAVEMWEARLR